MRVLVPNNWTKCEAEALPSLLIVHPVREISPEWSYWLFRDPEFKVKKKKIKSNLQCKNISSNIFSVLVRTFHANDGVKL
jgi:hypothetical protein